MDVRIPPIETDRLRLVSLSVEFLQSMIRGGRGAAQAFADFVIPSDRSLPKNIWVKRRLEMIEADPEQHPWMYRAIVRKHDNRMVGHISFHHKAPDPDLVEFSELAAELGYTVEAEYRRNGYARESAVAMMHWAYREHGVRTFILSISPTNLPSLKMAESMNFKRIGERMDEIDGLEYAMRADIEDIG